MSSALIASAGVSDSARTSSHGFAPCTVFRAYVAGVGLFASWILAASLLWDAPWWQRLAPVLFKVQ